MKIFLKILAFVFKNGIYLSIYGTKQNEKIVVMASKNFSRCSFEIPYEKLNLQHADEIKEKLLVLLKAARDEDTPTWMENKKKSAEHDIAVIEKYNKYGNHH
jgi:hypothetical protein